MAQCRVVDIPAACYTIAAGRRGGWSVQVRAGSCINKSMERNRRQTWRADPRTLASSVTRHERTQNTDTNTHSALRACIRCPSGFYYRDEYVIISRRHGVNMTTASRHKTKTSDVSSHRTDIEFIIVKVISGYHVTSPDNQHIWLCSPGSFDVRPSHTSSLVVLRILTSRV